MAHQSGITWCAPWLFGLENGLQVADGGWYIDMQDLANGSPSFLLSVSFYPVPIVYHEPDTRKGMSWTLDTETMRRNS